MEQELLVQLEELLLLEVWLETIFQPFKKLDMLSVQFLELLETVVRVE